MKERNLRVILADVCVKLQMRFFVCQAPCPFWVHFGQSTVDSPSDLGHFASVMEVVPEVFEAAGQFEMFS